MNATIEVETQGISDDWITADSNFEVKSRGLLNANQMLSAMLHLSQLDTPDDSDPCAPQIMTSGTQAGAFSFIGQGGTIFCPETDTELTASQASDLAFGKRSVAPPPPMPAAPRATAPLGAAPAEPSQLAQKRKFGLRGVIVLFLSFCFFVSAIVMVFGVFSMKDRGMPQNDILAAITISGGLFLIGILTFLLALKLRRTQFYDAGGRRVAEDGSVLPFIVMADSFVDFDSDDGGFDGDFD
jgi:hypothetical protein